MTRKLTESQREVLRILAEGKRLIFHRSWMGHGEHWSIDLKRVHGNTANSLLKSGYLKKLQYRAGSLATDYEISADGRKALENEEQQS